MKESKKMMFDEIEVLEKDEIARKFNDHTVNSIDKIVKEIPKSLKSDYNMNIDSKICK